MLISINNDDDIDYGDIKLKTNNSKKQRFQFKCEHFVFVFCCYCFPRHICGLAS